MLFLFVYKLVLPECAGEVLFVGDYSESNDSVLVNTSSGDVTPLPGLDKRVYSAAAGGNSTIFFTSYIDDAVWSFDVNTPDNPAQLVANVGKASTQAIAADVTRELIFVSVSSCCIKVLSFGGTGVRNLVSRDIGSVRGLAVDDVNQ